MLRRLVPALVMLTLTAACGRRTPEAPASGQQPAAAPAARDTGQKASNANKAFFARISKREIGDDVGKIEERNAGLLVHPGASTPTSVTFRLGGELKQLTLRLFIGQLPPDAKGVPQAGTVNAEILLDGKSAVKQHLDRNTDVQKTLDVAGVQELTLRVDNADGKPWWDWFFVSVVSAT